MLGESLCCACILDWRKIVARKYDGLFCFANNEVRLRMNHGCYECVVHNIVEIHMLLRSPF